MILKTILTIITLSSTLFMNAQKSETPLWQGKIPNSIENKNYKEDKVFEDSIMVNTSKVSVPTLMIFKPKNPNGTVIIICPGGGYSHLAMNKEGYKVAEWLNTLGITALVLKYRLPSDLIMTDKSIGPLQDAQEAMRYVRRNAKNWQINPDKVGIMGFSAGGHLASTLATHYNEIVYKSASNESAKPNFCMLIYPVIEMEGQFSHTYSKINLIGAKPTKELENKFSNQKQVNSDTPITFLVHASDDKTVLVENSIDYYLALKNNKVSAEMHIYEMGGHGFGLGKISTSKFWTKDAENWLKAHDFAN